MTLMARAQRVCNCQCSYAYARSRARGARARTRRLRRGYPPLDQQSGPLRECRPEQGHTSFSFSHVNTARMDAYTATSIIRFSDALFFFFP
jgi:hypothetical protein